MSLEAEIEEFRKMVAKLREQTDKVDGLAKTIPDTTKRELSTKFKGIQRELVDLSRQMRKSSEAMDRIVKKWSKDQQDYL